MLSLHLAAYYLRAVGASGHGTVDALDLEGGLGQGLPGAVPAVMSMCVVPFIIPDAAKLVLAAVISRRVAKLLKLDREHAL